MWKCRNLFKHVWFILKVVGKNCIKYVNDLSSYGEMPQKYWAILEYGNTNMLKMAENEKKFLFFSRKFSLFFLKKMQTLSNNAKKCSEILNFFQENANFFSKNVKNVWKFSNNVQENVKMPLNVRKFSYKFELGTSMLKVRMSLKVFQSWPSIFSCIPCWSR